jgi:four helix bundle protein
VEIKIQKSNIKMTIQKSKLERERFKEEFGKRLRQFALRLIEFVDDLPAGSVRVIANQLMRSGTSVGANYFEARAASSKNDFIIFFTHSLKSANESKFWIETLLEARRCDFDKGSVLLREVREIANILAASIITLKGRK